MNIKDKLKKFGFYSGLENVLNLIKQDPYYISEIENPTEEMKLMAVNTNGLVIYSIKNPSEQVQLAAVRNNLTAIRFIEFPYESVQLEVIKNTNKYIRWIKYPTEKVILTYISKYNDNDIDLDNISDELAEKIYEIVSIKDVLA